MILTKVGGTFRKINFDGIINDKDGKTVNSSLITVINPSELSGTLASGYIINFTSLGSEIKRGDSIKVKASDGIPRNNIVKAVGINVIEVEELINDNAGATILVENAASIITLDSSIEEGIYFFSDAETLSIKEVFLNISISYAEMKIRYKGISSDYDIELASKVAIDGMLLDFSFDASFTSIIDIGQLKGLIILKMIQDIEAGKGDTAVTKADIKYNKALAGVFNKIKLYKEALQNIEVLSPANNNDNSLDFTMGV